jgi:hypothetical protein
MEKPADSIDGGEYTAKALISSDVCTEWLKLLVEAVKRNFLLLVNRDQHKRKVGDNVPRWHSYMYSPEELLTNEAHQNPAEKPNRTI